MSKRTWAWLVVVGALAGCGGGSGTSPVQTRSVVADVKPTVVAADIDLTDGQSRELSSLSYGIPAQGIDKAQMTHRLSSYFNGRSAGQPETLMGDRARYAGVAKQGGLVAKSVGITPVVAHRFYNSVTGVHFYTMSEVEKTRITESLPQFKYEGPAFYALNTSDAPLSPVYRFYGIFTGTHFYTINPAERDYVLNNFSAYFRLEGIAWYATTFEGPGWLPMHRFFNSETGTHFYTTSEEERQRVSATLPYMEYEGIGYYVRGDGLPLTRSPVAAGNDGNRNCVLSYSTENLASCDSPAAVPLPSQVEGRREMVGVYAPRYVEVVGQPPSDCATDQYTGLTWEKKSNWGLRDGSRRFTHLDRTDLPQVVVKTSGGESGTLIDVPRNPTQAELDASSNSLGYVNYVNSIALCGFTDWRIPTSSELVNVMHLLGGRFGPIDTTGRLVTSDSATWTLDQTLASGAASRSTVNGVVTLGRDEREPFDWQTPVAYSYRAVQEGGQFSTRAMYPLMLVRGTSTTGPSRFTAISITYGSDAAGNVVLDTWSGLQWRRCVEGQRWTGASCSGMALRMQQGAALNWAADRPGWRLAGVKELETLRNHRTDQTQIQSFTDQFPLSGMNPLDLPFWSMSIYQAYEHREDPVGSGQWGFVDWLEGFQLNYRATPAGSMPASFLSHVLPSTSGYVRLVRVHP